MPIITLTSDWGLKDHYLATMKGSLLSRLPGVNIVDISHEIPRYNIFQAAFVLKNCYKNFPDGTIHIIAINGEASVKTPHTLVVIDKQYFIAADTGIFSLIFDSAPEAIYEITTHQESDVFSFPARDVFIKVACHIANGGKLAEVATSKKEYNKLNVFKPVLTDNEIRGVVIYVDSYENVLTNITEEVFKQVGKGRKFSVVFRGEELDKIHTAYSDVPQGEILAIFGATGFLEIAINKGNAAGLLGLDINETVRIEFRA
jgi:S-adenosyl-L-methionine hydrolase (adenosine-forming)